MHYGRFGTLTARPGRRDAVVSILLRGAPALKEVGCEIYLVNVSEAKPDLIWVSEVWTSSDAHRASLSLPAVRAAIAEAMPMLTGEFESVEFSVAGGLGLHGEAAGEASAESADASAAPPQASPSRTALGVAWLRAAHQLLDPPPRILEDPAAVALFGPTAADRLRAEETRLQAPGARVLRAHVLVRSRYAEDRLARAVERSVRHYVVLGAGYDTFIVRQPAWARDLRIVEVDRPAIQQEKQERLARAGLIVPDNVTFLSVDFETETLADALARGGVQPTERAFFSWLGVTMYLTEEAIDAVLATVAAYPAGSEIVLTFAQPRASDEDGAPSARGGPGLAERAAAVGEPWLSFFTPGALERKLRDAGFVEVEFLTPEAAEAAYFRAGGLPFPPRVAIASAIR
jgi:methyltransferase (TIGR00027 family)